MTSTIQKNTYDKIREYAFMAIKRINNHDGEHDKPDETHDDIIRIKIHIDVHGNLYFDHDGKIYQLNVDRNNEPYLDDGDYHIITDHYIDENKRENTYIGKIVKSEVFVNERYFPEDNGNTLVGNNTPDDDELYKEPEFTFYKFNELDERFRMDDRENGEINALYDTFIYEKNDDIEKKSHLIFRTKMQDETSIYRVNVYILNSSEMKNEKHSASEFYFRTIGCFIENKYELIYDGDKILCAKI